MTTLSPSPSLSPPNPPPLSPEILAALSDWAAVVSCPNCPTDPLNLGIKLEPSDIQAVSKQLQGLFFEQGHLFSVSCVKLADGKQSACDISDPLLRRARLNCSCHGAAKTQADSQIAPNHIGTGCSTQISILGKGLITINTTHNHDALSEAVLERSIVAQTCAFDQINHDFENELVAFCLRSRSGDRIFSVALAKSYIRGICKEKGISFVPNTWLNRIYDKATASLADTKEHRNNGTGFISKLLEIHPENSEIFYGTDEDGCRTLRAAAWIPPSSKKYIHERQYRIKSYAAYDDTFGGQGGYNVAALVTTDENGSMMVLAYFLISSNLADVHCFVMRFVREKLLAKKWLRYVFSDEHKSIAEALREELPFASHLLCMLHKMWNISARKSSGPSLTMDQADSVGTVEPTEIDLSESAEELPEAPQLVTNTTSTTTTTTTSTKTPLRFPKAMSLALYGSSVAEINGALETIIEIYPDQANYVNNTIRPNLSKLAAPYRAFLPLNSRSTSQLAESFFSVGKKGAIDPKKSLSSCIESLDSLAESLIVSGSKDNSSRSERLITNMDKAPFCLTDSWGKEFVLSIGFLAPGARCDLLEELLASPYVAVEDLAFADLANEVGQLKPSSSLSKVIRGEVKYALYREGYSAKDAAFIRWASFESHTKLFFSASTNEATRPHVVGVGSGGELACTCGGLLETLVPCKHMLAACKVGKVAINLLVHSAPYVRTVKSSGLQNLDLYTTKLGKTRNKSGSTVVKVNASLPFDHVVQTLDVLQVEWRLTAAASVVSTNVISVDATDSADALDFDENSQPEVVSEKLNNKRLREETEFQQSQLIIAMRALPLSAISLNAIISMKDDLLKLADKSRSEAMGSQGVNPGVIAIGSGPKHKTKRKRGMGDVLKTSKAKTNST